MDHITNVADENQVKKAAVREKSKADIENADMKFLLNTVQFRRFAWKFLAHCKVFETPIDWNGSRQYYNIGIQDAGRKFLAEITDADSKALVKMMEEGIK